MTSLFAASALALGLLLAAPQALAQTPAADKQQIDAIVETFRSAIIKKDTASFMKLFLHEGITWTGVFTGHAVEREYANRPDPKLPRPPKYFNSSPRKFIENIAKAANARAETFDNVRIDTDGDVAQVWFDYSFLADGKVQNWGKESWQMVRTEAGWKIAAVVWSMEDDPALAPSARGVK